MSVAFRRESDEEHKEPRFELPIPPGPNPVTARGRRLIAEHEDALRMAVAAASAEDAAPLKRELRYWTTRGTTAVVAPPPPVDEVAFGSRVTVRMAGATRVISIVGSDEADPAAGRVGFQAPLARALIGAAVGERLAFADVADAIEVIGIEDGSADAA